MLISEAYLETCRTSKHSWHRGPTLHPIFKFCPTPPSPPPFLSPSVVLFFCLNGWSRRIWCASLLNDIMDLHISSLNTIVPEGPWCVFYATRYQAYWGLTHNLVFCSCSDLISHIHTHTHTHTYTHTHTTHSGASRMTHRYKYLFTPPVMCSQQFPLLQWRNNSLISKIYFPQCLFFSKIIHL